jgi:hypothetical protein
MTTPTEAFEEAGKLLDKVIYKSLNTLIEKWNMNNGAAGFAEFYATHPSCRFDEPTLEEMASMMINGFPNFTHVDFHDIVTALTRENSDGYENFASQNRNTIIACASDTWIQEQYNRWFEGHDRFLSVCQYHLADGEKLFFNWLIRK